MSGINSSESVSEAPWSFQPTTTYNPDDEYTDAYYKDQVHSSLEAARIVLPLLWKHLQPNSVVDVGCGRGAWLKAFHELGSTNLQGLDGTWNNQTAMIDSHIRFRGIDLNQPFTLDKKADLAMSVEVAEHLEPSSSVPFIDSITKTADTVLFGAAYLFQNGPTHINERRHTFWGNLFLERGFVAFDLFRPTIWGDERIPFWYRQNTFLYVKKESAAYAKLKADGLSEMADLAFQDCTHPSLYLLRAGIVLGFRNHVSALFPSFVAAIRRKWGKHKLQA